MKCQKLLSASRMFGARKECTLGKSAQIYCLLVGYSELERKCQKLLSASRVFGARKEVKKFIVC